MAQSIGFIGLGIMGQPMALNLVKTGHKVTTFNRTRSKAEALEKAGATVVASPAEAARQADVVMIIVSDTAAVEEVVTGKGGILETLRAGAIVIDSSTISPSVSRKLACLSAGKGAAVGGAVTANANLNAAIGTTTTTPTTTTTTATNQTGTTTTGMTGSSAVAGFESSPQVSAGSETGTQGATSQTQGQTVAGVQNLPSTGTSQDTSPLVLLGAALMAIGGALLRRPKEQPAF